MASRRAARRNHPPARPPAGVAGHGETRSHASPCAHLTVTSSPSVADISAAAAEETWEELLPRARQAAVSGKSAAAIALYVAAISKGCTASGAFNDLGTLLARRGQLLPALIQFELALTLDPGARDIAANLTTVLESIGQGALRADRPGDAVAAYVRLAQLAPDSPAAHGNAGLVLLQSRAPARALPFFRRAVELQPASAAAHVHLGAALYELNEREAEAEFARAIALDPGNADAHVNLAAVCNRQGQLSRAVLSLGRALEAAPDHGDAHANLAGVLRERGEISRCMEHYRRALALKPDVPHIFSNYLLARQGDPTASPADLLADHVAWAARFAKPVEGLSAVHPGRGALTLGRRLRIGYVSGDFRQHAVASFIEPILKAHDRGQVHVTCYSDAAPDEVTARIQSVARPDGWRDTRQATDEMLARLITEDQIDVLVDLAGHTAGNRLLTFARRPAPVQVTYCGYPGTTGLVAMDWRLTDAIADPEKIAERHHVEQLWRLPHGFLCFQPDPAFGPPAPVPSLARPGVTFGSFNNLCKLNDDVLAAWARVLRAVDGSRLLLKSRALSDPEPRARLLAVMARHGLESSRIAFAGHAASSQAHAELYSEVDLALDPFPYNGTTTTCEALWMGVPVVTLAGQAHAGRVGASLLRAAGCPELVTESLDGYVAAAVSLGRDAARLAAYRCSLRARMSASPLTDAKVIARDLEAAYQEMWRRCGGSTTSHLL